MMEITVALKMHGESLKTRENVSDISLRVSGKGRLRHRGREVATVGVPFRKCLCEALYLISKCSSVCRKTGAGLYPRNLRYYCGEHRCSHGLKVQRAPQAHLNTLQLVVLPRRL